MFDQVSIQKMGSKKMVVGNNIVSIIRDNIIHVIAVGEQTTSIAFAQDKINKQLACSLPGKISYLVDLNRAGKNSPEARKLWKQVVEARDTAKVALYGLHPVARVLAQFVIAITNGGHVRFFRTKQESINWIQET